MKKDGPDILKLKAIQDYIQQVADAFSVVLNYEVAIVDVYLEVLVGTGKYRDQIGVVYDLGTVNYQMRYTPKSFFVIDPPNCKLCQNCKLLKTCKVLAGLFYPIKLGDKLLGSISLYAFDETQKENMLKDFVKLKLFLQHLVELISGKLNERVLYEQSKKAAEQFDTLINSVREGIMAVDYQGKITHVNRSATELLMVPANLINGRMLEDVFSGISLQVLMKMIKPYMEQDIFYKHGQKTLHFMSTATEIEYGGYISGFVLSLRSIKEMRKLAGRFIREERKYTFDGILSQNTEIVDIKKKMCTVAKTDSTVLITGESGTGKELFAHAIHHESLRQEGPFIVVNCGAIPENLLESELFGYEEGAFTGARRTGKPGKFELADGGTIFLDEIGDLPLQLQVKLLRVLQERMIERIGGTKPLPVDVRVIAATNKNLEEMINTNQFRSDLYYRLSVIPFHIPPLRERMEDLELLIHCFIQKFNLIFGKQVKGYTHEALAKMHEYPWPGNVRELENAIEYSTNVCPNAFIDANYLPNRISKHGPASQLFQPHQISEHSTASQLSQPQDSIQSIVDMEKNAIIEALKKFGTSNQAKENIAKSLGMGRSTLYRKIKKMGIEAELTE
ncbi:Sigma-54-dependent transcriptional regulator [uncultured Sporomusa sp.]|uniref:Sigma-54-dependent transcriptional regulator n=1 Tax=uncultured Sporomusa sp. TaxID=307249 RepID=A0A212LUZ3_9FIRM|nr:sigma 54-interacting transcriptional regulator [uncultured Sporomusa sp.]SCM81290.1 Sigma-54-dependent transcriptional regulator [uncultured Sporomusa sp.]